MIPPFVLDSPFPSNSNILTCLIFICKPTNVLLNSTLLMRHWFSLSTTEFFFYFLRYFWGGYFSSSQTLKLCPLLISPSVNIHHSFVWEPELNSQLRIDLLVVLIRAGYQTSITLEYWLKCVQNIVRWSLRHRLTLYCCFLIKNSKNVSFQTVIYVSNIHNIIILSL